MVTCLMSSTKAFLSPVNFLLGLGNSLLASMRSSLRDDRHLANTDSPDKEINISKQQ